MSRPPREAFLANIAAFCDFVTVFPAILPAFETELGSQGHPSYGTLAIIDSNAVTMLGVAPNDSAVDMLLAVPILDQNGVLKMRVPPRKSLAWTLLSIYRHMSVHGFEKLVCWTRCGQSHNPSLAKYGNLVVLGYWPTYVAWLDNLAGFDLAEVLGKAMIATLSQQFPSVPQNYLSLMLAQL